MTSDESSLGPPVAAAPVALTLGGSVYYYAMLLVTPFGEDVVYRHAERPPWYGDYASLQLDLASDGIPLVDDARLAIDVDRAQAIIRPSMSRTDRDLVLTAWNSLDDLGESLAKPLKFNGRLANRAYEKLFWSLDIPSITPDGRSYRPNWQRRELRKLSRILHSGVARVARSIMEAGIRGSSPDELWANQMSLWGHRTELPPVVGSVKMTPPEIGALKAVYRAGYWAAARIEVRLGDSVHILVPVVIDLLDGDTEGFIHPAHLDMWITHWVQLGLVRLSFSEPWPEVASVDRYAYVRRSAAWVLAEDRLAQLAEEDPTLSHAELLVIRGRLAVTNM